jgi:hypothetical protein
MASQKIIFLKPCAQDALKRSALQLYQVSSQDVLKCASAHEPCKAPPRDVAGEPIQSCAEEIRQYQIVHFIWQYSGYHSRTPDLMMGSRYRCRVSLLSTGGVLNCIVCLQEDLNQSIERLREITGRYRRNQIMTSSAPCL